MILATDWTTVGLWLAVIGMGAYHGINPGMGWPLAVSAGLMGDGSRDVFRTLGPLAVGHFLAMASILLPFAALATLIAWQQQIRLAAGLFVIAAGIYLLINRRHPRFLARIRPSQLTLWSFAVAMGHGAGLMLVPIYLGLCQANELDAAHQAAAQLMRMSLLTAIAVAVVHTIVMILSGGLVALVVHQWLGVQFIAKTWFNLDVVWALSLILVGCMSISSVIVARV